MGNNCFGRQSVLEPILMSNDEDSNNHGGGGGVVMGQAQPLIHKSLVWKSDVPLTPGQLQGKRDTFWETSRFYEGRKEIWDALKAAIEAAEEGDYELADAILTGANISLPKGRLTDAYDELGCHYSIPVYCISKPSNMITVDLLNEQLTGATDNSNPPNSFQLDEVISDPLIIKIRLSNQSKDIKLTVSSSDTIYRVKQRLEKATDGVSADKCTLLYSGRILSDTGIIGQIDIPKGFIIQAIVRQ